MTYSSSHLYSTTVLLSSPRVACSSSSLQDMPPLQEHKHRSSSKTSDNGKTSSSTDREGVKHNSSSSSSGNREKSRDKSKSDKERHGGGSSSKHRNKDREKDKSSYPSSSSLQGSSPSSASKVSSKVRCSTDTSYFVTPLKYALQKYTCDLLMRIFAAGDFEDEEE